MHVFSGSNELKLIMDTTFDFVCSKSKVNISVSTIMDVILGKKTMLKLNKSCLWYTSIYLV